MTKNVRCERHLDDFDETLKCLILRLPRSADAAAWREFVELYEPLVLRFARRWGLQEADSQDLVQRVFTSVAAAVDRLLAKSASARFDSASACEAELSKLLSALQSGRLRLMPTQVQTLAPLKWLSAAAVVGIASIAVTLAQWPSSATEDSVVTLCNSLTA